MVDEIVVSQSSRLRHEEHGRKPQEEEWSGEPARKGGKRMTSNEGRTIQSGFRGKLPTLRGRKQDLRIFLLKRTKLF